MGEYFSGGSSPKIWLCSDRVILSGGGRSHLILIVGVLSGVGLLMAGRGVAQFLTGAADVVCLGNLTGTNNLAATAWPLGCGKRRRGSQKLGYSTVLIPVS